MAKAEEVPVKTSYETRNGKISCVNLLDTGENLNGPVTITSTPSGLTFSSSQVNSDAVTIKGATVATGKAILFSVTSGSSRTEYKCKARCATNSTPAQTVEVQFRLLVYDE